MQNINFFLEDISSQSSFNRKTSSNQYIKQINLFIQGKDRSLKCTGVKCNCNDYHKTYLPFEISSEVEHRFYKCFFPHACCSPLLSDSSFRSLYLVNVLTVQLVDKLDALFPKKYGI